MGISCDIVELAACPCAAKPSPAMQWVPATAGPLHWVLRFYWPPCEVRSGDLGSNHQANKLPDVCTYR